MLCRCIFEPRIVMRSHCESVTFVNPSPVDAFDVSELYEVLRFICIRVFYALVTYYHDKICNRMKKRNLRSLEEDYSGECLPPPLYILYTQYTQSKISKIQDPRIQD